MSRKLQAVDLFCGAGGFTTGAEQAGIHVALAIDHWRIAIQTHQANHPAMRHLCARIDDVDPRHDPAVPELDLILASPECTHHSIARGGRPIDDRRRATPWNVCVWVEAKLPRWVVVENVREFRDWGPLDAKCRPVKSRKGEIFRQWIRSLEAIGYQVDSQILNAADYGAATKRLRLFIVARRGRSRRDIPWPDPTHAGRWRPAYEIIDWSRPCPSIFTRTRPLADKTLRRIEAGLRKFVGSFVVPFLLDVNHGGHDFRTHSSDSPLGTVTSGGNGKALCFPSLDKGSGAAQGADEPLDPVTTITNPSAAMRSLLQTMHDLGLVDIGFSMLDIDELARAQGFPEGYALCGTKAEQVRQVGNAVCPPVAEALCRTIQEAE